MAVSRLSKQSIQAGFPKQQTVWDQSTNTASMEAISSVTLTSVQLTVEFNNIPSTYSHLQLRIMARESSGGSAGFQSMYVYFNGDTASNYSNHRLFGLSGTLYADGGGSTNTFISGDLAGSGLTSGMFGVSITDFLDYTNTSKNKTLRSLSGGDMNGSSSFIEIGSGCWYNTNAITSIRVQSNNAGRSFDTGSTFSLYGIK
jgi:hypothetical protein